MARRIGLVSCSKAKLDTPARARDLYSPSDLFRKASGYCAAAYDDWYILSAKYGLVRPDDQLEPYDVTLKNMTMVEKKRWGEMVARQIRDLSPAELNAHAGREYVKPLTDAGLELSEPLAGLSIGRRKQWYLQNPVPVETSR